MSALDDALEDLFNAIERLPDVPDPLEVSPAEAGATVNALWIAHQLLGDARMVFETNARLVFAGWEPDPQPKRKKTR